MQERDKNVVKNTRMTRKCRITIIRYCYTVGGYRKKHKNNMNNNTSSDLVVRVVRVVTLCRVTTVTCVLSTCWPERPERLSIADLCVDLVFFYRC